MSAQHGSCRCCKCSAGAAEVDYRQAVLRQGSDALTGSLGGMQRAELFISCFAFVRSFRHKQHCVRHAFMRCVIAAQQGWRPGWASAAGRMPQCSCRRRLFAFVDGAQAGRRKNLGLEHKDRRHLRSGGEEWAITVGLQLAAEQMGGQAAAAHAAQRSRAVQLGVQLGGCVQQSGCSLSPLTLMRVNSSLP